MKDSQIFIQYGIILTIQIRDFILRQSRKTQKLHTNNTIYYCVDEPNPPYKGVRGKGKVKIHEDVNHNISIAKR